MWDWELLCGAGGEGASYLPSLGFVFSKSSNNRNVLVFSSTMAGPKMVCKISSLFKAEDFSLCHVYLFSLICWCQFCQCAWAGSHNIGVFRFALWVICLSQGIVCITQTEFLAKNSQIPKTWMILIFMPQSLSNFCAAKRGTMSKAGFPGTTSLPVEVW